MASATENVTTSRNDQKEDATTKKPNFYDVAFDVRILMWKGTLQDNTRAVLARAPLRAGNEYIQVSFSCHLLVIALWTDLPYLVEYLLTSRSCSLTLSAHSILTNLF